jgi:hypothetical protein
VESHYLLLAPAAVLSSSSSGYRGVARPTVAQSLPAEGPARELWMNSLGIFGRENERWSEGFPDRDAALAFRDRLHELGHWFECVEVTSCASTEEGTELERRAGFLGYDVANTDGDSVLAPRMMNGESTMAGPGAESRETWELCRNFCMLAVNANGLLERYRDAALVHQITGHLVKPDEDRREYRDLRVYALHAV